MVRGDLDSFLASIVIGTVIVEDFISKINFGFAFRDHPESPRCVRVENSGGRVESFSKILLGVHDVVKKS